MAQTQHEEREWEIVDLDLALLLKQLKGPDVRKLENLGPFTYNYGAERSGTKNKRQ